MISLAGLIIAAVLAWCLARSPGMCWRPSWRSRRSCGGEDGRAGRYPDSSRAGSPAESGPTS
jgi:hypothetical protein